MKVIKTKDGVIQITEIPEPEVKPNSVFIETTYSAISPGTEMSTKQNSKESKILGYSAVGNVLAVGDKVADINIGQKVACYGAPYVMHAERLSVPKNLVTSIPTNVDEKDASFVGHGAIAIHGLRQAELQFGETVVIVGLGIIGQIMCQIANAASYNVIGYDLLKDRCLYLEKSGIKYENSIESLERLIKELTNDQGVDAVILCAGSSNGDLINKSFKWIRDRGKVVIVGDMNMNFSRKLMFKKEAKVLISRAGGPGRYDVSYEWDSVDYPIGYVRWTEGRNMAEYIRLLSEERLDIGPLVTDHVPMNQARNAYQAFSKYPEATMGMLFQYGK